MRLPDAERTCPKCDNNLDEQTDGSVITVDIAHHGERVRDAEAKLDAVVYEARAGTTASLRLIVGGGVIRDAVLRRMLEYQRDRLVHDFSLSRQNPGVIDVRVRRGKRE